MKDVSREEVERSEVYTGMSPSSNKFLITEKNYPGACRPNTEVHQTSSTKRLPLALRRLPLP